nr:ImmA/IrrE family metallo-endopeptidase [uncultured Ligilactobacillus sp.]
MRFEKRYFEEYDIELVIIYSDIPLDTPATFISKFNVIIIDNTKSNNDIYKALLHELGHKIKHNEINVLYNSSPSCRIKMEHEANEFMINELITQYLKDNYMDANNINYVDFANDNMLDDINIVKDAIKRHLKTS